eukprot:GILJ01016653.1.p1 GENE.GILJ01016653.1~~GILJ01016653.1.p1  ORF type:complete len:137 (-),score=4.58 GILJ01016653.1:380-790(-)
MTPNLLRNTMSFSLFEQTGNRGPEIPMILPVLSVMRVCVSLSSSLFFAVYEWLNFLFWSSQAVLQHELAGLFVSFFDVGRRISRYQTAHEVYKLLICGYIHIWHSAPAATAIGPILATSLCPSIAYRVLFLHLSSF